MKDGYRQDDGWPESIVRKAKLIKRRSVCGRERGEFGIEPSVLLAAERAKEIAAHHGRFSLNDVAWLHRRAAGDDDLMDDDFLLLYDVPEDMLDLIAGRKGERLQQLLSLGRGDGLVSY